MDLKEMAWQKVIYSAFGVNSFQLELDALSSLRGTCGLARKMVRDRRPISNMTHRVVWPTVLKGESA